MSQILFCAWKLKLRPFSFQTLSVMNDTWKCLLHANYDFEIYSIFVLKSTSPFITMVSTEI